MTFSIESLLRDIDSEQGKDLEKSASEVTGVSDGSDTLLALLSRDPKQEMQKEAAFTEGLQTADELDKSASFNPSLNGDSNMSQAQSRAEELLQSVLTKLAGEEANPTSGIPAGVAPNLNQINAAEQVAQQLPAEVPTPGGTVNQILDAVVARAQAAGAIDPSVAGQPQSVAERADPQVEAAGSEEQEKIAAVNELMSQGLDMFSAVEMVKEAALAIEHEDEQLAKAAALDELIAGGLDFVKAAALIEEASAGKAGVRVSEIEKAAAVGQLMASGVDFTEACRMVSEVTA